MATLKIRISGMTGAADEARIEEALRQQAGVLGAIASRTARCVEVEYEDDELSMDRVLQLVQDLGYGVELCG